MNPLDILRQVTKPMTDAEAKTMVRARYGAVRENASRDDPVAAHCAERSLDRAGSGKPARVEGKIPL